MVHDITAGKNARDAGFGGLPLGAAAHFDIAAGHVEMPFEYASVRLVPNGDEYPMQFDIFHALAVGRGNAHASDAHGIAQNFIQSVVPLDRNLALGFAREQTVLQDFLRLQLVAAVDQGHMACDIGEVQGLFDRCIAATDDSDGLVAVEETVAGGAGRHALAHECGLAWQAKILRACTRCDDHRVRSVIACPAGKNKGPLRKINLFDIVVFNARSKTLRMLAHAFHQFRAHDTGVIAWPVIYLGRGHQLPANFNAGNHHRRQVRARGINCGGVASGAGANDDDRCVAIFGHERSF